MECEQTREAARRVLGLLSDSTVTYQTRMARGCGAITRLLEAEFQSADRQCYARELRAWITRCHTDVDLHESRPTVTTARAMTALEAECAVRQLKDLAVEASVLPRQSTAGTERRTALWRRGSRLVGAEPKTQVRDGDDGV